MLCLTEMVERSIYDLWEKNFELYLGWFEIVEGAFIHYSKVDF